MMTIPTSNWVLDENYKCHCILKSCKATELYQLVLKDFPNFRHHKVTKPIQENRFNFDKK